MPESFLVKLETSLKLISKIKTYYVLNIIMLLVPGIHEILMV